MKIEDAYQDRKVEEVVNDIWGHLKVKTKYTREELTLHNGFVWTCALCGAAGLEQKDIRHGSRCVFHIFGVNEVTIRK